MSIYEPYIKGIRRLFFASDDKGERISFLKILLLMAYILGMTLLFIQFATVNAEDLIVTVNFKENEFLDPVTQIQYSGEEFFNKIKDKIEQEYEEDEYDLIYNIRLNVFGNIAITLNFFILIGLSLFLIAEFTPLNSLLNTQQLKEYTSRSIWNLIITIIVTIIIIISVLGTIYGIYRGLVLTGEIVVVINALSVEMGNGVFYPWLVIQPILLFGGLLVIFDLITSDYDLGEKFGRKTITFLLMELLFVISFFIFLLIVLENLVPQIKEGVKTTYEIEGLDWVNISGDGLHYLFLSIFSLTLVGFSLILGIFIVERIHDKKKRLLGLLTFSGLIPCLMFLIIENLLIARFDTYIDTNLEIIIILMVVLVLLLYRQQSSEGRGFLARKKPFIPLLLLFGLFMMITKTIPALFLFEGRLKALTNLFDIAGFLVILILSIFRIITLPEASYSMKLEGKSRFNPIEWWKRIPLYVKTLFFFYLSFVTFFMNLESYTIASILSSTQNIPIQSEIQITRLAILSATVSFGFLYVFSQYKPLPKSTTSGPLKVLVKQAKKRFKQIDDSILQKADFLDIHEGKDDSR